MNDNDDGDLRKIVAPIVVSIFNALATELGFPLLSPEMERGIGLTAEEKLAELRSALKKPERDHSYQAKTQA